MTTPNTTPDPAVIPPGAAPPGVTPSGTPAPDAGKPPAAVAAIPPVAAAPVVATPPEGPRRARLDDSTDDIPPDADLLELSTKALKSRLDRHSRAQLKERFGTDDPAAIKTRLDKLEAMEKAEEDKRLAEMTENDRLKEQLATETRAREHAETRYRDMRERQMLEQEDRRVFSVTEKYIKPKMIKRWLPDLAAHIASMDEDELKDPDAVIEAWCKKQVEEFPEIAKDFVVTTTAEATAAAEAAAAAAKAAAPKVPITTSTDGSRAAAPPQSGTSTMKTAAPNRQNSMTDSEWRQYKRDNNIAY